MSHSEKSKRRTSYELEDHLWFPNSLRAYQTDFLGGVAKLLDLYEPATTYLEKKITKGQCIVDLASGSGIPALITSSKLYTNLILCDKFPNAINANFINQKETVNYIAKGLDIIKDKIPDGEHYTMFNSLHHFPIAKILTLLKKVRHKNANATFFEPIQPGVIPFIKVALSTLILPFFITPFIRPFRWDRLIYTYLFPVGVIATFWDGLVSVSKSYSLKDLETMKKEFAKAGVNISVGILPCRFANITYLELQK